MPRKNFSNKQKAKIYARDRAICCFSGASLWLLDYGAAPSTIDWADHIHPSALGGEADLENGSCASWLYNWVKRQHTAGVYLYQQGRPTADFYLLHETLSENVAAHLKRFSTLHWSDWYFNRAVFHVLLAASQKGERRMDGKVFKRDSNYWCGASLKSLDEWRRHSEGEGVSSFKSRGLLLKRLTADQMILFNLCEATQLSQVKRACQELTPYVKASEEAMLALADIQELKQAKLLLASVRSDPYVVKRTKDAIATNIQRLF